MIVSLCMIASNEEKVLNGLFRDFSMQDYPHDKIEIVLKNYITNAVSHCTKEKQIVIGSRDLGETVEITVFNTGENISEHDLPELWDSFYGADKAHGRSESRFGLGLSIVKSIMDSHKCNYGVANTENGVVFRFEVSKDSSYYDGKK